MAHQQHHHQQQQNQQQQQELFQPDVHAVVILQWALEKVAIGDVLYSPGTEIMQTVIQSFLEFLSRGTCRQRQEFLQSTHPPYFLVTDPEHRLDTDYMHEFHKIYHAIHDSETPEVRVPTMLPERQNTPQPSHPASSRSPKVTLKRRLSPEPTNSSRLAPNRKWTGSARPNTGENGLSQENGVVYETPADMSQTSQIKQEPAKLPHISKFHCRGNGNGNDLLCTARQFFEARLRSRKSRAGYLIRAVQGFLEAPPLPPDFSRDLWDEKSAIFTKPQCAGSTERFRSLYEGHRKIKRGGEHYLLATRFCYIYLEHDLEQIIASQDLVLSQGRGKVTAAFQLQAESISITMDTLRAERKAGRGYIRLLMEGGPGFVLRMGNNVSTIWERKLSVDDIALIIEFIKTHAVDLYNEIKSFDRIAVQALLYGFIAYGWTPSEIRNTKSSLFEELQRYINLDEELNVAQEADLAVAPLPTPPISEHPQSPFSQMDFTTCFEPSQLDFFFDDGNKMPETPLSYIGNCEPETGNQQPEVAEMAKAKIDDLSNPSYDIVFEESIDEAAPQTQHDFTILRDLFAEFHCPDQFDGWLHQ